jgi:hypothetical protein
MVIQGKCHGGNIAFTLTWEPDPAEIPERVCCCSFCIRHAGVWTSHPKEGRDEGGSLSEYRQS